MCIWWKKPRLCRLLPGVAHYCSGTPGPRWPHARWLSRGRVASCAHVSYSTGRVSARAVSRAPRHRIWNRGAGAVVNLCSRWQPSPPLVRPGLGIEATSGPPDCSALQRSTVRRLGVHSRLEKWALGTVADRMLGGDLPACVRLDVRRRGPSVPITETASDGGCERGWHGELLGHPGNGSTSPSSSSRPRGKKNLIARV